jgi:hypothetical protein
MCAPGAPFRISPPSATAINDPPVSSSPCVCPPPISQVTLVLPELHASSRGAPNSLALVVGGTGITPAIQLVRALLDVPRVGEGEAGERAAAPVPRPRPGPEEGGEGALQIWLLYSNRQEADILLREEVDALAKALPHQLHVRYECTCAPASPWPASRPPAPRTPHPSSWSHGVVSGRCVSLWSRDAHRRVAA